MGRGDEVVNVVMTEIPRLHTALAEWAACIIFIQLLEKRFSTKKTIGIAAAALIVQMIFLFATGEMPIQFWIFCMAAAFGMMVLLIYLCLNITGISAVYYGIQAFITAEFTAAFEWMISCRTYERNGQPPFRGYALVPMVFVVLIINVIIARIMKNVLTKGYRLDIDRKGVASAAIMGCAIFVASNLNFCSDHLLISSHYAEEIARIRMLIDLGGIAMLYAHLLQCCNSKAQKELGVMQNVLQNQYLQYKFSKESIDLINYKYHDLKHQIRILRREGNLEKNAFLDKMEEEIRQYEIQNKTGNSVLDTILTSNAFECDKNGITLTCVANGSLLDFINTMDICSIFGNALDNAVECEKEISDKEKRLIHVTVSEQKGFVLMRFENYYEEKLNYNQGELLTTKKEKQFHGYGIKSIKYTANKYGGAVHIDAKDHWFALRVLIPLP